MIFLTSSVEVIHQDCFQDSQISREIYDQITSRASVVPSLRLRAKL